MKKHISNKRFCRELKPEKIFIYKFDWKLPLYLSHLRAHFIAVGWGLYKISSHLFVILQPNAISNWFLRKSSKKHMNIMYRLQTKKKAKILWVLILLIFSFGMIVCSSSIIFRFDLFKNHELLKTKSWVFKKSNWNYSF